MATTVTAPVGNTIGLAEKYLPLLDEKYVYSSRTAILDTASEYVRFTGANTVKLFELDLVGMGNYDRNAGFVPGDITGTWRDYVLNTDRGRSYMLDYLDNDETLGLMVANTLSQVEALHIVPEVDAFRFAEYAAGAGNSATPAVIASGSDAVDAIDAATVALDDDEVPYEGRILFVTPTIYGYLKAGITRMVMNDDRNVNYNVDIYNDMRVITVPQKRFYTAIDLAAPTTSAGTGGFSKDAAGVDINFMIIHPSAVMQVMKHYVPRFFSPAQNIEADAWLVQPRFAHGAWVKHNKADGIYLHASTT